MLANLKNIPLFRGLQEDDLNAIARKAVVTSFPRNAVVLTEGEFSQSLYFILSGRVKVYLNDENGKELVLDTKGFEEYFGEMVLDEGPRSASVATVEPCQFAVISTTEFRNVLLKHPEIALQVIKNLIHMGRILNENVRSLAMLDVYGRVSRMLLDLADERQGELVIPEKLTQQEIASRVETSREVINRILRERKRAEQLLTLAYRVTRCLAEADSASGALKTVIRIICETEGWECGRYFRRDDKTGGMRVSEAWGIENAAIQRFITTSGEVSCGPDVEFAGRVWQSDQPQWVSDVGKDARTGQKDLATGLDLHGAFFFPVLSEGKTIGVFGFNSHQVREPDERLLKAVNVIGSQIGQFLQRMQAEKRIEYLATYDTLTSLSNRNMFRDRLTLAIARAKRSRQMAALMFLDLDRFKEINDTLGHAAGDKVLQATAGLLGASLRDVDTISRLGGDEFTVILENIIDAGQVKTIVEKIKEAFSAPIITQKGRDIFVTASIGIALYPLDADNIDALLQAADVAMYHAKQKGRNTYEFYASELKAR